MNMKLVLKAVILGLVLLASACSQSGFDDGITTQPVDQRIPNPGENLDDGEDHSPDKR